MAELRRELLADLSGTVLGVGAGNGLNFVHYPAAVTEVIAVEPEPYLRDLATQAAQRAPVPVTVLPGTAEQLPLSADGADAAVLCLVLCSISDRAAALAELVRVLRSAGALRFLEHCLAETPGHQRVQRVADARSGRCWPEGATPPLIRSAS